MTAAVQLRNEILLITALIRREHDLRRRPLPVIGDEEEVPDLVEQPRLPLLARDVLAEHDHAIVLATLQGTVAELGELFRLQTQRLVPTRTHDRVLDVFGPPPQLIARAPRPLQGSPCLRG